VPVNDYQLLIADGRLTCNLDSFPLYTGIPRQLEWGIHSQLRRRSRQHRLFLWPVLRQRQPEEQPDWKKPEGQLGDSYRYQELQGDANYEELTASDNGTFYRGRPPGEPALTIFRPSF